MAFQNTIENMDAIDENIPSLAKLRAALVENIRFLVTS